MAMKIKHPLYGVWQTMLRRCYTPTTTGYADYGGRGITVCERWRTSFECFVSDMGPRPQGYTLDRIEVNGNYEPANCRWATRTEQQRNRRDSRWLEFPEGRFLVAELAQKSGMKPDTIMARHAKGMTYEQVMAKVRYVDKSGLKAAIEARVAMQRARTHCKYGHELTEENAYITPQGWRTCRRCHADRQLSRREMALTEHIQP